MKGSRSGLLPLRNLGNVVSSPQTPLEASRAAGQRSGDKRIRARNGSRSGFLQLRNLGNVVSSSQAPLEASHAAGQRSGDKRLRA
ncbi:hypothetical protein NDU88_007847 [Pleurodeles waltl]|uniref:Uncharacterized protein n=1 Tax=Pleurodeles waltl TaxID=8319 RepID=A0AAV7VTI4_PLEWA|nr:hypothetical protein NDU88_007847 [Pleurodeles waltl]